MCPRLYRGLMLEPKVVRDFARFIIAKKESLEDSVTRLNRCSKELDESWRDRQHHKFTEEFEPHMANLKKLFDLLDQYAQFCNKAANQIEEYNID